MKRNAADTDRRQSLPLATWQRQLVRGHRKAMAETPLQRCQRHVSQGGERIARQESLIVHLQSAGHERMLLEAHVLLNALKASQQLGEEHLAREIARTN